ncbi:uncharacterized protein VTP21DRAFT_1319 [Calcarisporiella thermophila]|uniref:uncharacterized protein n=1 Tax=Calcarisporiella thermophila TaxID=911321 RepID=UPI003743F794
MGQLNSHPNEPCYRTPSSEPGSCSSEDCPPLSQENLLDIHCSLEGTTIKSLGASNSLSEASIDKPDYSMEEDIDSCRFDSFEHDSASVDNCSKEREFVWSGLNRISIDGKDSYDALIRELGVKYDDKEEMELSSKIGCQVGSGVGKREACQVETALSGLSVHPCCRQLEQNISTKIVTSIGHSNWTPRPSKDTAMVDAGPHRTEKPITENVKISRITVDENMHLHTMLAQELQVLTNEQDILSSPHLHIPGEHINPRAAQPLENDGMAGIGSEQNPGWRIFSKPIFSSHGSTQFQTQDQSPHFQSNQFHVLEPHQDTDAQATEAVASSSNAYDQNPHEISPCQMPVECANNHNNYEETVDDELVKEVLEIKQRLDSRSGPFKMSHILRDQDYGKNIDVVLAAYLAKQLEEDMKVEEAKCQAENADVGKFAVSSPKGNESTESNQEQARDARSFTITNQAIEELVKEVVLDRKASFSRTTRSHNIFSANTAQLHQAIRPSNGSQSGKLNTCMKDVPVREIKARTLVKSLRSTPLTEAMPINTKEGVEMKTLGSMSDAALSSSSTTSFDTIDATSSSTPNTASTSGDFDHVCATATPIPSRTQLHLSQKSRRISAEYICPFCDYDILFPGHGSFYSSRRDIWRMRQKLGLSRRGLRANRKTSTRREGLRARAKEGE